MSQKILVAEDELIIAADLCDTVEEAGFEVQGPHSGISSALLDFQKEKPDLAILDMALNGGEVFPLAQRLTDENVPIIFRSDGQSHAEVEARFPSATVLAKPSPPAQVLETVNGILELQ